MGIDDITLGTAILGAVAGLTGVVLGILNTSINIKRDKVRLRVVPQYPDAGMLVLSHGREFQIEVLNRSEFSVVITDIGFKLKSGKNLVPRLGIVAGLDSSHSLPRRLEPRTSCAIAFSTVDMDAHWHEIRHAYARTQCGTTATGTTNALKGLVSQARRNRDGSGSEPQASEGQSD